MQIYATQCCAVRELADLSAHETAHEAMEEFCRQLWRYNLDTLTAKPSGFYTFTGVIRHTDGTAAMTNFTYGPNFAAFIRKNKLGKVSVSHAATNCVNHPTHVVRIWAWCPDEKALRAWYKKNQTPKEVKAKKATAFPAEQRYYPPPQQDSASCVVPASTYASGIITYTVGIPTGG